MSTPPYRVLPSTMTNRARAALAKPYQRVEDAVADMGVGIVVDKHGRLVAFHEDQDQRMLDAYAARVTERDRAALIQHAAKTLSEHKQVMAHVGWEVRQLLRTRTAGVRAERLLWPIADYLADTGGDQGDLGMLVVDALNAADGCHTDRGLVEALQTWKILP